MLTLIPGFSDNGSLSRVVNPFMQGTQTSWLQRRHGKAQAFPHYRELLKTGISALSTDAKGPILHQGRFKASVSDSQVFMPGYDARGTPQDLSILRAFILSDCLSMHNHGREGRGAPPAFTSSTLV